MLRKRYKIEGRLWVVAAIYRAPKPWAWLVSMDNPSVQVRYPVQALGNPV